MFGKHHHQGRRSTNIVFVIFRLCLSMVIFAVLLGGVYSAYKHFTGIDPLQLDPRNAVSSLIKARTPQELVAFLSSLKLNEVLDQSQKVLGSKKQEVKPDTGSSPPPSKQTPAGQVSASFSFVLIADSHNANDYLGKALVQAKEKRGDLKFIIGLGDYSDVGSIAEFALLKQELDNFGLRYFLTPGDHDLWDSRDKSVPADTNFLKIFGPAFQSFTYQNFRFIVLNNSDNYLGMSEAQLDWLELQLQQAQSEGNKAIYVFMHEPIYHPSSDHVMGMVNQDLKKQAKNLLRTLIDAGVKQAFFGHTHFFSKYNEPESNLAMAAIGALTPENNAQMPRYAIVTVFEDGSLEVEDVEVK